MHQQQGDLLTPSLSVVIPHWPFDDEIDEALRRCVTSLPSDCEKVVVVNDGTGFGKNVNVGLRLASGDFIGVVNNDAHVAHGDVYDLCLPGAVASPLVIGDTPAVAPPLETGGFHGCFWIAPREVLDCVGLLDNRFEGASGRTTICSCACARPGSRRDRSRPCAVMHRGGLTMLKVPGRAAEWYGANERRFEEKWGWAPPPTEPGSSDD